MCGHPSCPVSPSVVTIECARVSVGNPIGYVSVGVLPFELSGARLILKTIYMCLSCRDDSAFHCLNINMYYAIVVIL